MTAQISYQITVEDQNLPDEAQIHDWVNAALEEPFQDSELTVRVVNEVEITHLNRTFRDKDYATNVLAFPFSGPQDYENILGDIVICAPIVAMEAEDQKKGLHDHWAHLIVHGVLHLQGYDHLLDEDAEKMEQREIEILAQFNIPNPYEAAD